MLSYCCATQIVHAIIARPMTPTYSDADILTSARMAAGMTSRARRPFPHISAG
jgi:hypothetical protein